MQDCGISPAFSFLIKTRSETFIAKTISAPSIFLAYFETYKSHMYAYLDRLEMQTVLNQIFSAHLFDHRNKTKKNSHASDIHHQ